MQRNLQKNLPKVNKKEKVEARARNRKIPKKTMKSII
jgi:hypothetical protein